METTQRHIELYLTGTGERPVRTPCCAPVPGPRSATRASPDAAPGAATCRRSARSSSPAERSRGWRTTCSRRPWRTSRTTSARTPTFRCEPDGYEIRVEVRTDGPAAVGRAHVPREDIATFLSGAFAEVVGTAAAQGTSVVGPPFGRNDPDEPGFEVSAGFPVGRATSTDRTWPCHVPRSVCPAHGAQRPEPDG